MGSASAVPAFSFVGAVIIAATNGASQVRERANSPYSSGDTTKPDTKTHAGTRAVNTRNAVKDRDGLARYRRFLHI